jgi:hypothetical protein
MPIAAGRRMEFRDVAYIGVTAGVILAGFEAISTAFVAGPGGATMPLRMAGAIVLGPSALDSQYPLALAALTGLALHLLLSSVAAGVFATIVARITDATEGELMTTSGELALAGSTFGTAMWLVGFYVVAPLAGWTWFSRDVHHIIAFLGYAFFFGCPLGWMYGRVRNLRPLTADFDSAQARP